MVSRGIKAAVLAVLLPSSSVAHAQRQMEHLARGVVAIDDGNIRQESYANRLTSQRR